MLESLQLLHNTILVLENLFLGTTVKEVFRAIGNYFAVVDGDDFVPLLAPAAEGDLYALVKDPAYLGGAPDLYLVFDINAGVDGEGR